MKENHTGDIRVIEGYPFGSEKVGYWGKNADLILHLAGQVAVTSSVIDPITDFETNARGTLNILESVRLSGHNPIFIYSSTNKVYGALEDIAVTESTTRYVFNTLRFGVAETRGLDFHSPYGCSKGAADQYVRDYSRIYGLNTVVFRQSCIYGPHQHGVEDQGWVAWFMIALSQGKQLTIYGNGKQVRDLLHIDDLLSAYDAAARHIKTTKGQIYNIGGGPKNTLSIWHEFKPLLERLYKRTITPKFSDWRPGDQPIYISDIRKAKKDFGWLPKTNVSTGIQSLFHWIQKTTNEGICLNNNFIALCFYSLPILALDEGCISEAIICLEIIFFTISAEKER